MLTTKSVLCLQMASASAHGLPIKLGLTLCSSSQRVTSPSRTWAALSSFSKSSQSWNRRYSSVQSLLRPRHLQCHAQPLIPTKTILPSPQNISHRTRKYYSEMLGRVPQIVIDGQKYNALVLSSSPMPDNIRIVLDRKPSTTLGNSNEPATKSDPTSPNTSSQNSTKSFPSRSSSKKGVLAFMLIVLVVFPFGIYVEGWEPDC